MGLRQSLPKTGAEQGPGWLYSHSSGADKPTVTTRIATEGTRSALKMINLETTIENIFATRRITRHDQRLLMCLFAQDSLSSTDKDLLDRVYEALHQGRLRVVD